ncbi:MAG: CpsD/CapB family tyrosine-protein kinase [Aliishimia sp.]
MEKIQSAISKARIAREGRFGQGVARVGAGAQRAVEKTSVDEAWDDLLLMEPSLERLRSQRIVTVDKGREASQFDKLRTRIMHHMQANGWRRVAITSPGPSSGKSTTVLNLGFSLARQMTSRVIISEMDLRKPSLRRILQLKTERNFTEVVRGNGTFAEHAVRLRRNLALGMARNFVDSSAELLQSPALAGCLDEIEETYDPTLMLFDMPPFQVSDDMMAFADKVDCVLIMAAAEKTKMRELDECEREISNVTNVLGVVLNKCRYEAPETAYEYYN